MREQFLDNIDKIKKIISKLEKQEIDPETAEKLFKKGNKMLEECSDLVNEVSFSVILVG